jgi:hypothetical protein
LAKIDRPFGHRINQAIHAYVANYPDLSEERRVLNALADMLELRILPKLRGIELEDETPRVLRQIADLTRQMLQEETVAERIDQGVKNRDVFHWTG